MEPISKAFSKCWRTTFWTVETRKGTEGCRWLTKGNGLKLEHADPRLGAELSDRAAGLHVGVPMVPCGLFRFQAE